MCRPLPAINRICHDVAGEPNGTLGYQRERLAYLLKTDAAAGEDSAALVALTEAAAEKPSPGGLRKYITIGFIGL